MSEIVSIGLLDTKNTRFCGFSLAQTIHRLPLTILLSGDLGAGKTTFTQGFAEGLGITTPVTSPTFALEQRYPFVWHEKEHYFLHMDCYRLSAAESEEFLSSTDDHEGIRCIEWANRRDSTPDGPYILIDIRDAGEGRMVEVCFFDAALPSKEQVQTWRTEVMLPPHICEHCDVVGLFSERIAKYLLSQGRLVRPLLLLRAGELHDLLRFVDFTPQATPNDFQGSPEEIACWNIWTNTYPDMRHEEACTAFLHERHFPVLAEVIATHGRRFFTTPHLTIEQKILFYADKRVKIGEIVSLEERFIDLEQRYPDFMSKRGDQWRQVARKIEEELFGDSVPF